MLPIGARGGVRLIRRQACRVPRAVIAHTRRVSIKYPLPPSMVGASAWLIVKSPRMTRVGEGFGQVGSGSLPVALDHFRSPSASTTRQGPNTVLPQKGAVGWGRSDTRRRQSSQRIPAVEGFTIAAGRPSALGPGVPALDRTARTWCSGVGGRPALCH